MQLTTEQKKAKGILLAIIAASSFGFIPLFARIAYAGGFNPFSFSLLRSIFTTIVIFIILKTKNRLLTVEKKQIPTLFKASFFGYFLMMVTLFTSYNHMATGLATTLHFIYPVATMAGAVIIFKEKTNLIQAGALCISIFGIYLLVGVKTSGAFSITGFLLALVSGLFYAYYILTVCHGNIKNISSLLQVFYISLFNSFTLLITSILTGTLSLDITFTGLLATIMVALISSVIGMVAFQAALKVISAATSTILSTFEVVTSLIIGVTLLGESLSVYQMGGSILIISSVIVIALSEKQSRKPE